MVKAFCLLPFIVGMSVLLGLANAAAINDDAYDAHSYANTTRRQNTVIARLYSTGACGSKAKFREVLLGDSVDDSGCYHFDDGPHTAVWLMRGATVFSGGKCKTAVKPDPQMAACWTCQKGTHITGLRV